MDQFTRINSNKIQIQYKVVLLIGVGLVSPPISLQPQQVQPQSSSGSDPSDVLLSTVVLHPGMLCVSVASQGSRIRFRAAGWGETLGQGSGVWVDAAKAHPRHNKGTGGGQMWLCPGKCVWVGPSFFVSCDSTQQIYYT